MGEPSKQGDSVHYDPRHTSAWDARRRLMNAGDPDPSPEAIEAEWWKWYRADKARRDRDAASFAVRQAEQAVLIEAQEVRKKREARLETTGHEDNFYSSDDVKESNPRRWGMIGTDYIQMLREVFPARAEVWAVMLVCLANREASPANPEVGRVLVRQSDIADILGMHRQSVHRSIGCLFDARFLVKKGDDLYVLGPE